MEYTIGPGTLKIIALQGKSLAAKDPNGKSDPYCSFGFWDGHKSLPDLTHKTKYKKATLNPTWYADKDQSEKTFNLRDRIGVPFKFTVWDYDTVGDPDYMGEVEITLDQFIKNPTFRFNDTLKKKHGYKGKVSGSIIFAWEYKSTDPAVQKEEEKIRAQFLSEQGSKDLTAEIEAEAAKASRKSKHRHSSAVTASPGGATSSSAAPGGSEGGGGGGVTIVEPTPVFDNVVTSNKVIDKLRHDALLGDSKAAFELGKMYAYGSPENHLHQNDKEALKYYMIAAEAGHAEAQFKVGLFFQMGYGTGTAEGEINGQPNLPRAFLWYEKAVAQNQPDAMTALAEMYESGWVVDVNIDKAIDLYERAETFGEKDCLSALGRIYKEKGSTDEKYYQKSIEYLNKAIGNNDEDSESIYHLAELYEHGQGTDKNVEKAIELYKKVVQLDEESEDGLEALKRLGVN